MEGQQEEVLKEKGKMDEELDEKDQGEEEEDDEENIEDEEEEKVDEEKKKEGEEEETGQEVEERKEKMIKFMINFKVQDEEKEESSCRGEENNRQRILLKSALCTYRCLRIWVILKEGEREIYKQKRNDYEEKRLRIMLRGYLFILHIFLIISH